jgi:UDP-N-acetylmuramate: L-alanyl-gamma-D-glutamyl-meso-diaminopimelate ligase
MLPEKFGWFSEKINSELDAIILGMHARKDNPELLEAQRQGLKIYSYPEYIYEQSKEKLRVVIGGSHGKTSITAMVLHVLNKVKMEFDYMVGAQLEGFETMVKLSDAPVIILEGDEYLSSPIDRRPKFLWYKPQIAVLTGIAWDHINVFPTFDNYVEQFSMFTETIQDGGYLFYYQGDKELQKIAPRLNKINAVPYSTLNHKIEDGKTILIDSDNQHYSAEIFGEHNLQNLNAAKNICIQLGISEAAFFESIQDFSGAAKRLENVYEEENYIAFKDFAHSPSKLKATINAVKSQFPEKELVAAVELHTFSSLNKNFLSEYKNAMDKADTAAVFFSPKVVEHKNLEAITPNDILEAFNRADLNVFTESDKVRTFLENRNYKNCVLLLMSSGNFGGLDLNAFAASLAP